MSTKKKDCPDCDGKGRRLVLHMGTVIDSYQCRACGGTGRIKRKAGDSSISKPTESKP